MIIMESNVLYIHLLYFYNEISINVKLRGDKDSINSLKIDQSKL